MADYQTNQNVGECWRLSSQFDLAVSTQLMEYDLVNQSHNNAKIPALLYQIRARSSVG